MMFPRPNEKFLAPGSKKNNACELSKLPLNFPCETQTHVMDT